MYINVCDACICDIIDVILIDLCKTSISFYRMKKIYHIYHTVLHRMYMYLSCCHVYPLYTCMVTYWFIMFFKKVYYWLKVNTIFHKSLINTPLYFEIKKIKLIMHVLSTCQSMHSLFCCPYYNVCVYQL